MMITAQFTMGFFTLAVAILALYKYDTLLVVCISLFLITYQALMGNLFWPYVQSVIMTESGFSMASLAIWSCVLFMSLCT